MRYLNELVKNQLFCLVKSMETNLNTDILTICSPIHSDLDKTVEQALLRFNGKVRDTLTVIIDTNGGFVEVVERIANNIRTFYRNVTFIVPDKAMSAGTILVMSGNRICMGKSACLGPIDPQVWKDGKFVPALSYLIQFERFKEASKQGKLSSIEYALAQNQFNLAELHLYEQARELSIELITNWLPNYKFKDWTRDADTGKPVTPAMRRNRAKKIAEILNHHERWHSHSRSIDVAMLRSEIKLEVEEIPPQIANDLETYFGLLRDFISLQNHTTYVHTREYY